MMKVNNRVIMTRSERHEIVNDPMVKELLGYVNREAAGLNMVFLVDETSNGNAVEIVWRDQLRPKREIVETNAMDLWCITSVKDARGALRIIHGILIAGAARAPVDVEDGFVASARQRANRCFILIGAVSLVGLALALWLFAIVKEPQFSNLVAVSVSATLLAWCSNEWRLTHRKNTDPVGHEMHWWAYMLNGFFRLPLTLVPVLVASVALAYAT